MSAPNSTNADLATANSAIRSLKNPDTGRYASNNIRLSAVLCALGFPLRDDAQPCERIVEYKFKRRANCLACLRNDKHEHVDIRFWHSPTPIAGAPITQIKHEGKDLVLSATDVDAWWRYPGKYTIIGFDDALNAMRRVFEAREWLVAVIKGTRAIVNQRFSRNSVITTSLRFASAIRACGFELLAFEKMPGRENDRFVFPGKAARVVDLIAKCHDSREHAAVQDSSVITPDSSPEIYPDRRDDGKDLCIDWMLWALEYHARLMQRVRACGPMIEMREGRRLCRVHAQMPKTLRREFVRHF